MRRLVLLLCLLFATDASAEKRQRKQAVTRISVNGTLLPILRPTLNMSGPVQCSDNPFASSTDCLCPNAGILAQGSIQFVLAKQGRNDVDAKWVTANSVVVCTPVGGWPVRLSILEQRPGDGFTVIADAPDQLIGNVSIGCIGAVATQ